MSAARPLVILAASIGLGVVVFLIVDARTDDVSGATPGIAALIVVAAGIVVLVLVQRSAVARARRDAGVEAARSARAAAAAGTLTDPARLETGALLVAMAVRPVDERELVEAADAAWGLADRTQRSATAMTLLIIVLMVPALALQEPRLIVLAAIPIVAYAVMLAARTLRPGGTLEQAFAASDLQLAPLGLQGVERPDVVFAPRLAGEGLQSQLTGATVLRGERHGRQVRVTIGDGRTETHVPGALPQFALKGHRQRVRAEGDVPPDVQDVLGRLGASSRWTGMKLAAGPDGVLVRRSGADLDWLCDLWLAERLADVAALRHY